MSRSKPVLIENKYFDSVKKAARSLHLAKTTLVERCISDKWIDYNFVERRLPEYKLCCNCKQTKELKDFYKFCRNLDGKASVCKVCSKKLGINRRKRDPLKYKNYLLNYFYGISIEEYNKLFTEQNGCCAICGRHQSEFNLKLAVDHDHISGKIRGLLCNTCNKGLGCFKDDINLLNKAINYLNE